MAVSLRKFYIELYREYLEEASFLYEQRLTLLDDPEITWLDIEDFEGRFEPHIDGLVIGDALALDVCRQQGEEGDFGELHAAVRVFCRQKRWDLIQGVLEGLDFEDEERVTAVIDALSQELPQEWEPRILEMLTEEDTGRIRIAAHVIGFRRMPAGPELTTVLDRDNSETISAVIWALGRLRETDAAPGLFKVMDSDHVAFNPATALSLLRIGEIRILKDCMNHIEKEDWPILPIGLGGGYAEAETLRRIASNRSSPDILMAIALLGGIDGVDILMDALVDTELADFAAIALNLLTGAELYQDVFIPEEMDEDELFDEEKDKISKGEHLFSEGEEPGTTLTLPCRDTEMWARWWMENQSRFQRSIRYRNGKPYSPLCLLDNLKFEKSPRLIRQLAYEELVIRYDMNSAFETEMAVFEQKRSISGIEGWIEANGRRFTEGKWYFAGRIIT